MSIWPDWLKTIQLKARYLFGIWLLGSLILFSPDNIANFFRIDELKNTYSLWIGLATLAGFCFWLVQIGPSIRKWKSEHDERNDILNSIFYLPEEQKVILARALHRNNSIISLPISDALIEPLWNRSMIEALGEFEECFDNGPCKIVNFVWKFIKKNKNKILTEDIVRQLKKGKQ